MGLQIKYEYINIYYCKKYIMECSDRLSKDDKKIFEHILLHYNKYWMHKGAKNRKKNEHIFFIKLESEIVLFTVFCRDYENYSVAEIQGVSFPIKDSNMIWYFIDKVLLFLCSEEFYDYQEKKVISEEILEEIYARDIKKYSNNLGFLTMLDDIQSQKNEINFIYSDLTGILEPIKMYFKDEYIKKVEDNKFDLNAIIQNISEINYSNAKDTDEIFYSVPCMKNRPKQESYFKERMQIKKRIKDNIVEWYGKFIRDGKNKIVQIPLSEKNEVIKFTELCKLLERDEKGK